MTANPTSKGEYPDAISENPSTSVENLTTIVGQFTENLTTITKGPSTTMQTTTPVPATGSIDDWDEFKSTVKMYPTLLIAGTISSWNA